MRVADLTLHDLRGYARVTVELGAGLTVVTGRNGAGKTNLLEGLYFACTGRSCRTANDRELVRFGERVGRAEARIVGDGREHRISAALDVGQGKRISVDGATAEARQAAEVRPAVCVFLPDRLELIKGPPAPRRAHLDQVVVALFPARAGARRAYGRTLGQRNALLGRVRAGLAGVEALRTWDAQLAVAAITLMEARARAVDALSESFAEWTVRLGLEGEATLAYAPRSRAADAAGLEGELRERLDADIERGHTGHGPHRDDLELRRDGRALRAFGSQGQQRLALLALLMAERDALNATRGVMPLMLLDDVMSELDGGRRAMLVRALRSGGQALVTATEIAHVPGAEGTDVRRLAVADGRVLAAAAAGGWRMAAG